MIEEIHKLMLYKVWSSRETPDNTANVCSRNVHLYKEFKPQEIQKDETAYVFEKGLIDNDLQGDKIKNMLFLEAEYRDWLEGVRRGGSHSQSLYPEHWKPEHFEHYCYSERLGPKYLLKALEKDFVEDPEGRRHYISIWTKEDELNRSRGAPCTLGFWYQWVEGNLYVTFIFRSLEVSRNFVNDLYLHQKILRKFLDIFPTTSKICLSYFVTNAHIYKKSFDTLEDIKRPVIVILEGIDKTGKTELRKELHKQSNYQLVIIERGFGSHYAFDRTYKRESTPGGPEGWLLEEELHYQDAIRENRVLSVYLNPENILKDHLVLTRKIDTEAGSNLTLAHLNFLEYCDRTSLPILKVPLEAYLKDVTSLKKDYKKIAENVIGFLKRQGMQDE